MKKDLDLPKKKAKTSPKKIGKELESKLCKEFPGINFIVQRVSRNKLYRAGRIYRCNNGR